MTAAEFRKDTQEVYTEGSYSLFSDAHCAGDEVPPPTDELAEDFQAIGVLNEYSGSEETVRIVLGGELSPDEQSQWVARARYRIQHEGEAILLVGGSSECAADGDEILRIPAAPGHYAADVYAYADAFHWEYFRPAGAIKAEFGGSLWRWFRARWPKAPAPRWIAELEEAEDFTEDFVSHYPTGQMAVDNRPGAAIAYLFHLRPFVDGMPIDTPPDGWHEIDRLSREPEAAPLGLRSGSVPGGDEASGYWDRLLRYYRENPS